MLNQICNLACPYCFANEFVGRTEDSLKKDKSQITEENFTNALNFAIKSREGRVGLIGGEPLLHPNFERIVELAINSQIPAVHLFTNGVHLNKYFHLFGNDKFTILININSPEDVGIKNYEKTLENIDYLVKKMHAKNKISIGVNIYKENMDFDFILKIVERFGFERLRVAITIPNTNDKREESSLQYFKRMKQTAFNLFRQLDHLGCMPAYDCNGMPVCVTTDEEKIWLRDFWKYEKKVGPCNLTECHKCNPVIDVLPNLDVVRCFGVSSVLKTSLNKFENMRQLRGYFVHEIDSLMNLIPSNPECINCLYKNTSTCDGGCLAFKIEEFGEMKNVIRKGYFDKGVGVCGV